MWFKAIGIIAIVLLAAAVAGCGDSEPGSYHYTVSVSGLDGYAGGEGATILVPVPVMNGTPIFSNDRAMASTNWYYSGRLPAEHRGDWTARLVSTEKGTMLAFTDNNGSLANFTFQVNGIALPNNTFEERQAILQDMMQCPMAPVENATATNYTEWAPTTNRTRAYMSYIDIDKSIRPTANNSSIHIEIRFQASAGVAEGTYGMTFTRLIAETIPANVSGGIPVIVQ